MPSPEDNHRVPLSCGLKFALGALLSGPPAAPASWGWRLWVSGPIAAAARDIRGHIRSYLPSPGELPFPQKMPCRAVLTGAGAPFPSCAQYRIYQHPPICGRCKKGGLLQMWLLTAGETVTHWLDVTTSQPRLGCLRARIRAKSTSLNQITGEGNLSSSV